MRTYAWVGPSFTAEAWIEAVKKSRTFFSNGPLVEFRVNDRIPGEAGRLPAGGGKITLEGKVWSVPPLTKILIYHNGRVWKEVASQFREEATVDRSGWFSLVAEGAPAHLPVDPAFPQAGTNAIRVYVGEERIRSRESAAYFLRWIEKLRGMSEKRPGWRSEREKEHVFRQFEGAWGFLAGGRPGVPSSAPRRPPHRLGEKPPVCRIPVRLRPMPELDGDDPRLGMRRHPPHRFCRLQQHP
jgi:hypothetical protein